MYPMEISIYEKPMAFRQLPTLFCSQEHKCHTQVPRFIEIPVWGSQINSIMSNIMSSRDTCNREGENSHWEWPVYAGLLREGYHAKPSKRMVFL